MASRVMICVKRALYQSGKNLILSEKKPAKEVPEVLERRNGWGVHGFEVGGEGDDAGCRCRSCAVCCSVLQRVAVCCSVLNCLGGCCGVLQCVAVCCSVLQRVAVWCSVLQCAAVCCSVVQCGVVCCSMCWSVLQRVAVYCSVLQCCCSSGTRTMRRCSRVLRRSVLQCVAVCCSCSVLQCVAGYRGRCRVLRRRLTHAHELGNGRILQKLFQFLRQPHNLSRE